MCRGPEYSIPARSAATLFDKERLSGMIPSHGKRNYRRHSGHVESFPVGQQRWKGIAILHEGIHIVRAMQEGTRGAIVVEPAILEINGERFEHYRDDYQ